jgi:hypothetical protein
MARTSFAYPNPTGEWFGEMNNLVLYTEPSPNRPDIDGDGDVDVEDFGHVQACLIAVSDVLPFPCQDADFNNEGTVNAADVQQVVNCLSGANVPAAANCAP